MKNTTLMAIAFFFGAVANAQTGTPTQPTQPTQPASPAQPATPAQASQPGTDTAVVALIDTSVGKAYVSHPDKLQGLTTETLTIAHIFPAVGTFKASGNSTADVTITLDADNKGIVWVEGLPQGRFKALMKKAPSTYKIPAQQSESGKTIAEGTLHVDPATSELTIVLGRSFNDQDPASALTVSTTKKKAGWRYTGVKTEVAAAPAAPVPQQ